VDFNATTVVSDQTQRVHLNVLCVKCITLRTKLFLASICTGVSAIDVFSCIASGRRKTRYEITCSGAVTTTLVQQRTDYYAIETYLFFSFLSDCSYDNLHTLYLLRDHRFLLLLSIDRCLVIIIVDIIKSVIVVIIIAWKLAYFIIYSYVRK
jgi:hypothetical protein